jgi:hypothetical protein
LTNLFGKTWLAGAVLLTATACNPPTHIISADEVPRCAAAPGQSGAPHLKVRRVYLGATRYRLTGAELELDHNLVFGAEGEERMKEPIELVFEGSVAPGPHELTGFWRMKLIDYNSDHHFRVPFSHTVNVGSDGAVCSSLVLYITDDNSVPQAMWTQRDEWVPAGERPVMRYEDEGAALAPASTPAAPR